MGHVLAIDLGTTNFKAAVFDEQCELVAVRRVRTPIKNGPDGEREIDACVFQGTVKRLLQSVLGDPKVSREAVQAVSYSSQANSFLLLDEKDRPLGPMLVWNDAQYQHDVELVRQVNALNKYAETGMPRINSVGVLPAKLNGIKKYDYDRWARAHRVALMSDYLTWLFTGKWVAELGGTALTSLIDIHKYAWREDVISELGIDCLAFSELGWAGQDLGVIDQDWLSMLGLPHDCRFVLGCLDQYAGVIGAGVREPGELCETTGTVLSVVRRTNQSNLEFSDGGEIFVGPAESPGQYYQMCFSIVGGGFIEQYQIANDITIDLEAMNVELQHICSRRLQIELDRDQSRLMCEPVFIGGDGTVCAGEFVAAIMVGVADELKDLCEALCGDVLPREIVCVGGASKSSLWRGMKSRILGVAMHASDCEEPACKGAAILAFKALSERETQSSSQA
ncbi:FGGY-family carbohydrate kinase [Poriferisphaera sp. WC338]|uniref:FGGY-family carbohydrate kinase n=1 Tax=Poriferisphaera sp. WC338 TaxID=3425129 RepID=UPI003D817AF3